jgi:hypothetical protein
MRKYGDLSIHMHRCEGRKKEKRKGLKKREG